METTGIMPTMDIGGADGFGNGLWLFAILALMWGGFGNRNVNPASVEDISNMNNFTRMESQIRANADLTERKTDAINNGICTLGYEVANKFGETNALVIAENQKTRDLLQQNKIESLQAQISQLQLQQALAGVVRYPSSITYNGGTAPFCPGCCNNGNNFNI